MQMLLPLAIDLPADAYEYGERSSGEAHGVVLTKAHVVDLILDLVGYREDRDLAGHTLCDPSCGTGAFLLRAAARLLRSATARGRSPETLQSCLAGIDISAAHVATTQRALRSLLTDEFGVSAGVAHRLSAAWARQGDFLLSPQPQFDYVVGNPPYVRIEQISAQLQVEYRARYKTIFDRADLYVAFIERGLQLLAAGGVLGFICADRWTLNRYGAPLRQLVTSRFRVLSYVDLHDTSPFESEVIAYPSIFVIGTGPSGAVQVAKMTTATAAECAELANVLVGAVADRPTVTRPASAHVTTFDRWFVGTEPWTLSSPRELQVLRDLEARFPSLEEDGSTQVRIGVATGADAAFIVGPDVDVEPDRLMPLVMREDLVDGKVVNGQRFVINAFGDDGRVVDLREYPRLAAYLDSQPAIRQRHVAKKNPRAWFRTIDRVYPLLARAPKLLIPDIAESNRFVFEPGGYHPHHNLYFVTSDTWDLEVLGGLLSSKVALLFIQAYAVKMRGGYFRFQAQYLRRIRVPRLNSLDPGLAAELKASFRTRDFPALEAASLRAYGLDAGAWGGLG